MSEERKPPREYHDHAPDARFDGGDLDCGNGLLLLIRQHIDPLPQGGLLEILSTEISVEEDLPAWCAMTNNELVSWVKQGPQRSFLICKGPFRQPQASPVPDAGGVSQAASNPAVSSRTFTAARPVVEVKIPSSLPAPRQAAAVPPLAVMGIGSWPRPSWLLRALHERLEGRLSSEEFDEAADDAVRLAVEAQLRAGVDVLTDGEQRRDNYSSFVGSILDNCQLIPLVDLLPLVDDPEKFSKEMSSLDVPAEKIRHPAVFGRLGRSRPLAVPELTFVQTLTPKPIKIALPGPYLLTRTMWMECISDQAYANREELASDIVRVLREELFALLAAGAALVQFDEPVLSEVVFTGPKHKRSFMCGALSEKGSEAAELEFAVRLLNAVVQGAPKERVALHLCRGNWTANEAVALSGDYRPLMSTLERLQVGTLFLELCTPRAGEMKVLSSLPQSLRIGVGVVNQKLAAVEAVDVIVQKGREAIQLFGAERVIFTPDCGFATFADSPLCRSAVAEAKLQSIVEAREILRRG